MIEKERRVKKVLLVSLELTERRYGFNLCSPTIYQFTFTDICREKRAGVERRGLSEYQELPDPKEIRHVYIFVSLHV